MDEKYEELLHDRKRLALVCANDSEESLHMFKWYLSNMHCGEEIVLLNVYTPPSCISGFGKHYGDPDTTKDELYRKRLQRLLLKSLAILGFYREICNRYKIEPKKIYSKEKIDTVGERVLRVVEEMNADCIVMGGAAKHRKNSFLKLLSRRSLSGYLLQHSDVPIVAVPFSNKQSKVIFDSNNNDNHAIQHNYYDDVKIMKMLS